MVRAGWFWASLLFTVALSSSPQPRIVVTFPPPHTVLLQAHCAAQLAIEVRDYPASMGVPRVQVFNDTHVWATVSDLVAHVPSRVPCGEVVVHALLLGPDDEELDEVTHVFTVKDTETAQQEQQSLCSGGGTCVNPFRVAWIASPVVNSPNYRARVHIETQNSVSQGSTVVVKLGDWSTVEDLTTETIRADGRPLQEAVDGVAWAVTREYYNTIHVPHALPDGDHEGQVELWLGDLLVGKAPLFLTLLPGSGNTSAVPGGRANEDLVQRLVPRWQSGTVAMGTTTGESCRVAPAPPASPFLVDNYNLNKFYSQGIPRLPQHVYLPRFGTCALVSSNGNIKGSGLGAEIDGHDAVWRVNEAPAGGELGEDAGYRTTVRVMSPMMRMMSQLSAMHEGEHIVIPPGLWWNEPAQYPSWWEMDFWKWFHDKYKGEVNTPGQPTLIRPKHEFQIWAAKVKAVLGMGLGEYDWFDEQPEREIDNLRALGVQISSGWYSVLLATMLCENVTLFEYLPSLREDSHASCHYYKDTPPCRGQGKHCGPCERRALAQLSSTPKQQIRNSGVAQIDKDKRDALLGGGFTSCSPVDREWLSTTCTHDRCSELLG